MTFFVILGTFRGLIKELASLLSWIVSIFFAILLRPCLNIVLAPKISNYIILNFISLFVIFTVFIILTSILFFYVSDLINKNIPLTLNLTFGCIFGLIKGFFISSLLCLTIISIYGDINDLSIKNKPHILQKSIFYNKFSLGIYLMSPIVKTIVNDIIKTNIDNLIQNNVDNNSEQKQEKKDDNKLLNNNSNNNKTQNQKDLEELINVI